MVFALCGGDARQAELARLLLEDGHELRSWALERAELPGGAKVCASAAEALEGADSKELGRAFQALVREMLGS